MSTGITVHPFDSNSGDGQSGITFDLQLVKTLGLRSGSFVSQITINGEVHGSNDGVEQSTLNLADDEYINEVEVHYGDYIDHVKFTTNHARVIEAGNSGGGEYSGHLKDVRVIAIGGRSNDKQVNALRIECVDEYKESTLKKENVGFIIGYDSQLQTIEKFTETRQKTIQSYKEITERAVEQNYSASIQAEYLVKVTASAGLDIKNSSLTTVSTELDKEIDEKVAIKVNIPEGYVGIRLVNGNLMEGADGKLWMYPTGELSYSIIKIEEYKNVLGHYDLTRELNTEMPGLKTHTITDKNLIFYSN